MSDWGSSDLPPGWVWADLGDIADVQLGKMLDGKRQTGEHPMHYLRNINVQWHRLDLDDLLTMDVDPEERQRYTVRTGDLLICEGGEPGRCAIVTRAADGYAYQKALHRVRPSAGVSSEYLAYLFELMAGAGLLTPLLTGSTIRHLPREKMLTVKIPLPPVAEQARIVSQLASHLSQLAAALDALGVIDERLVAFERALIHTALTPKEGWQDRQLGDLLERIEAGKSPLCDTRQANAGEHGVIKVSAMTYGKFAASENKALLPDALFDPDHEIRGGDLLLSRANTAAYVGAVVLVPDDVRPNLLLSDKSLRLVTGPDVNARWLLWALRSRGVRRQIEARASGTKDSMRNISQNKLRALELSVPPLDEQVRTVTVLEDRVERVRRTRDGVTALRRRCADLRRALLRSACSGVLCSQDPSDEPADLLVKRIADGRRDQTRHATTRGRGTVRRTPTESVTQEIA